MQRSFGERDAEREGKQEGSNSSWWQTMNQCLSQQRAIRNFVLCFHWLLFGSDTPLEKASFYLLKSFFFLLLLLFFFPWGHKRKVDLFQIPHSPGIFAFCSMALNTENVFLQMVWSSNPQNTGWNFEGFCGWNVPAVLVEAIEVVTEPPSREAALSCCHFSHCFTGVGEAKHC